VTDQRTPEQIPTSTNFLERVRNKPVPLELFHAAGMAIAKLPEESRRTFERRAIAVIQLLDDFDVQDDVQDDGERGGLVAGIGFRMRATVRLMSEPEYRASTMKSGTPGMDFIHPHMVEAAASEPLVLDDDVARFEPKSFFKHVLKIAETHGEG
jgi:hypothetical protein